MYRYEENCLVGERLPQVSLSAQSWDHAYSWSVFIDYLESESDRLRLEVFIIKFAGNTKRQKKRQYQEAEEDKD
jgi:hypothetical protein